MSTLELLAKGSSSGGRSSSGSRSSGGSKGSTKGSSGSKSSGVPSKPPATKPGGSLKTADGKSIQTSGKAPADSKYKSSSGVVGDSGYSPRFGGGYSAPAGSVVYYPSHSFVDYLPWIYLFSQQSPQNDRTVVVQPDGKEVQAQPVKDGVDGLAVINWILLIAIAAAIIWGIVWGVNKITKRKRGI